MHDGMVNMAIRPPSRSMRRYGDGPRIAREIEPPSNDEELICLLNCHLASAVDLHWQVKQAHWNVRGPSFIGVHKLFDDIAEVVEDHADTLAERVGFLGGTAEGTVQAAVAHSFLPPYDLGLASEPAHIKAVVDALTAFSESTNEAIGTSEELGDQATADIFIEMTRSIDHQKWLVDSHMRPRLDLGA